MLFLNRREFAPRDERSTQWAFFQEKNPARILSQKKIFQECNQRMKIIFFSPTRSFARSKLQIIARRSPFFHPLFFFQFTFLIVFFSSKKPVQKKIFSFFLQSPRGYQNKSDFVHSLAHIFFFTLALFSPTTSDTFSFPFISKAPWLLIDSDQNHRGSFRH